MVTETPTAVLMGDIVGSENALPQAQLHALFNRAIAEQNSARKADLVSPLTITLGDEFQGLTRSLTATAEIARALRFTLLADGIDCRFVIGQVEVRTPLNPDRAWNMMGPGFGRARDKLNEKKPDILYRFSLADAPVTETLLDALGAGLSHIETGWTDQQRADIAALIGGMSASARAAQRGVSVHSVYKVRASGGYDVYTRQWQAIETALQALDHAEQRP